MPTHALILQSLADSIADLPSTTALELIRRCIPLKPTLIMTQRNQDAIIALARYFRKSNGKSKETILKYLLGQLEDVMKGVRWEKNLSSWRDGLSAPDYFTYTLTTELLSVRTTNGDVEAEVRKTIFPIIEKYVSRMRGEKDEHMIMVVIPSFHGLVCALEATLHPWTSMSLVHMVSSFRSFLEADIWSLIDSTVAIYFDAARRDDLPRQLLLKYWKNEFPLSGARLTTKLFRFLRTVMIQILAPSIFSRQLKAKDSWSAFVAFAAGSRSLVKFGTNAERSANREILEHGLRLFRSAREGAKRYASAKKKSGTDWYWGHLMAVCLQVAVLTSLQDVEVNSTLVSRMSSILSEDMKDQPTVIESIRDLSSHMASLDSLTIVATQFPAQTDHILSVFQRILLLSPTAPILAQLSDTDLIDFYRGRTLTNYCYILSSQRSSAGASIVSSFLNAWYSVPTNTQIEPSNTALQDRIAENILYTLGSIATAVKSEACIEAVLPILIRRLGYPNASPLDALIIEQLKEIALVSDIKVFKEVIDLFAVISKRSAESQRVKSGRPTSTISETIDPSSEIPYMNEYTVTAVLNAQMNIAQRLVEIPNLNMYLTSLLTLFVDKGAAIQKAVLANESVQASTLATDMGLILPILKMLLSQDAFQPHLDPSPDLKALFRNAWFYCILYCFVSKRMWISEWYDAVVVLARKTPVLISTGWVDTKKMFGVVTRGNSRRTKPMASPGSIRSNKKEMEREKEAVGGGGQEDPKTKQDREKLVGWFESDLELNAILRYGSAEQDLPLLRASLSSILPNALDIRYLTFAQVTYLLSVYHVESLRIHSTLSLRNLFQYFSSQIVLTSTMQSCMDRVALKIVGYFVDGVRKREKTIEREQLVLAEVEFLIQQCVSRGERSRSMGQKALKIVIDACPWIIWAGTFLSTILEVMQIFYVGCGKEFGDEDFMGSGNENDANDKSLVYVFSSSGDRWEIDLVEDHGWRKAVVRELAEWCISWMKTAIQSQGCGEEMIGRLKHFLGGYRELTDDVRVSKDSIQGMVMTTEVTAGLPGLINVIFPPQSAGHALAEELGRKMDSYPERKLAFLRPAAEDSQDQPLFHILESNAMNLSGRLSEQNYYLGEAIGAMKYASKTTGGLQQLINAVKLSLRTLLLDCQQLHRQTNPNQASPTRPRSPEHDPATPRPPSSGLGLPNLYIEDISEVMPQLRDALHRAAALMIAVDDLQLDQDLLHLVCWAPTYVWNVQIFRMVVPLWTWMAVEGGDRIEERMMMEFASGWEWTVKERIGMFSDKFKATNPFEQKMNYSPSNRPVQPAIIINSLSCHYLWIDFLSQRFEAIKERSSTQITLFFNILQNGLEAYETWSSHPLARGARFALLRLGLKALQGTYLKSGWGAFRLRKNVYLAALAWFAHRPSWSGVMDAKLLVSELRILSDFHKLIKQDKDLRFNVKTGSSISGIFQHLPDLRQPPPGVTLNNPKPGLSDASKQAQHDINVPAGSLNTLHVWNQLEKGRNSLEGYISPTSEERPGRIKRTDSMAISDAGSIIALEEEELKILEDLQQWKELVLVLLESEMSRLTIWYNPNEDVEKTKALQSIGVHRKQWSHRDDVTERSDTFWQNTVKTAWNVNSRIAVHMLSRYPGSHCIRQQLQSMILQDTLSVIDVPEALFILVTPENLKAELPQLKYLVYWAPVTPVAAVSLFESKFMNHPLVLQYAMRVLNHYPVDLVFFYVPQIVQALRYDKLGYVRQYILTTARTSQLFAHQIIWNMKANMYRDEESTIPDPIKNQLDNIVDTIVSTLSGTAKDFFDREFDFFDKVTSISGKLKPFIKKTKAEKKAKIDEEMKKISVDPGVYLPSNPESIVVDIDYNSGRPLQSHAKAPFMATFKIRRNINTGPKPLGDVRIGGALPSTASSFAEFHMDGVSGAEPEATEELWQSSIFKVGDDCRQDCLALQLISCLKSIFETVGLDLYLYPYRVVATAPGVKQCGVIEVVPKSISRDILGREKVNSVFDYFINKYGGAESLAFQRARNNLIRSLAAYSVALYLLQIKDRHNGNIMLDDAGHIVHIDFGFILDISPGGVNFESSPFKLTTEMIQVMGGSPDAAPYKWFVELCVRAYLACRPHADQICELVTLMKDSGLPCFTGEHTISNLRSRFQLERSERSAAQFMRERVYDSYENRRTWLYDGFQKIQNGIPF